MDKTGIRFINYGYADPGSDVMTVVCEIDGEFAGKYRGSFDGNVVRIRPIKRVRGDAPTYACVSPEYMINRLGQPLPPEHFG